MPANQYSLQTLSGWMRRSFLLLVFNAPVLQCPLCCLYSLQAVLSLILGHWCVLCLEIRLRWRCDVYPLGSHLDSLYQSASLSKKNNAVPARWITLVGGYVPLRTRCRVNQCSATKLRRIKFKFTKKEKSWSRQNCSNWWNKDDHKFRVHYQHFIFVLVYLTMTKQKRSSA